MKQRTLVLGFLQISRWSKSIPRSAEEAGSRSSVSAFFFQQVVVTPEPLEIDARSCDPTG